ncbi:sugar phosphate isomerase/epimerase [Membranicola marinus]|uniref:Sugar phosphate isomerase/epimerase n=1 Tax=Membranihabitans marinus TaxID=1227546 RepID=A0A953HUS4_9BACT|nr:sugar phosphate isomerase/epimerase [Membranihabitans marinus]MBY5956881.1 sugar phosphate isomerase/epimerase [Membranihabitans marinus]
MKTNRRSFFKKSGTGLTALAAAPLLTTSKSSLEKLVKPPRKITYDLGMAGYTFVKFSLDDALKMTQRVGIHHFCIKDFHLPMDSTDKEIAEFHKKCKAHDIEGYAVGPIYMKTEEEVNRAFDYAKRVGVRMIVGIPTYELLPLVDEKVKEYDFQVAIHNHGPGDKLYPTPEVIYDKVKDLDRRIGMCHDVGHTKRYGKDPVAQILKYGERTYDMHIKDVTEATSKGSSCEMGRGVLDLPAVFEAIAKTGYSGKCSIEYEKDNTDNLAGIAESVGYYNAIQDMM